MRTYRRALTIAGSDSGGGAGIQADLKTFSALGCYGMSVITAITAQNTHEVTAVHAVPVEVISAQLDAVLSDIGADAIKVGMLFSPEITEAAGAGLRRWSAGPVVVDPVMVSKSGDRLLTEPAVQALKEHAFPIAEVITPNLPEASTLLGREVTSHNDMEPAARDLLEFGARAVLLKGGHLEGDSAADVLVFQGPGGKVMSRWFEFERIDTPNTHGTGCTLSSAIASFLASGEALEAAVEAARAYMQATIVAGAGYELGHGHGPVHHFHALWQEKAP
jgi:hydroxymethylpyrimidine/phosphomethylpyrimidine kinase